MCPIGLQEYFAADPPQISRQCIRTPKWCAIVEVEMGVACSSGAGGVYCVEGGPREAVSRCGSAASKEMGVP